MEGERNYSPVEGDLTEEEAKAAAARAREKIEEGRGKDASGEYDLGNPEPYEEVVGSLEGEPDQDKS